MSTRIYNGFLLETGSSAQLMQSVEAFRPKIQTKGQQLLDRFLKASATSGDALQGWHYWLECRREIAQRGLSHPAVDTEFKLVFFPDGNRFLGIAYTTHEAWFRSWLRQPLVKSYGYWTSSDKPLSISAKAWGERGADWDRVLGDDTPAERGLTIDLHKPNGPLPRRALRR
ncbi:hypothetical protein [Acidithiobacillus thiooxidans]|uniref:hypothetical protein n=1 Tax=Acidithiobacillus thiooxidans TaxID=930 RepID=UPI0004E15C4C|nr:hypothetical protein [Acidithiobacillus thiooxidans]